MREARTRGSALPSFRTGRFGGEGEVVVIVVIVVVVVAILLAARV
jgi:hypothetical protein